VFESSKNQGTTFTLILINHINDVVEESPLMNEEIIEEPGLKKEPELKMVRTKPVMPEIIAEVEESVQEGLVSKSEITTEEIRILIVEDNDELRRVFVQSFKKLGEVFDAKNGMEAYEVANRIIPNAILTDFDMPGMDGLTLYNAIKENPDLNNIPVYVMITDEDRSQLPDEIHSEFLHFIVKPVNLEMLLQELGEVLTSTVSQPFVNTRLSERNSNLLKGGVSNDFIETLEVQIMQNIGNSAYTVEDLSESVGMSSNSLYLKLKNLNGLTPLDFIIRTKLVYAKSLIKRGESDLAEVARQAGFQNKDIFFSSFKKHFGFMPGTIMVKKSTE
jgi:CheY-like chemotaxis protein